MIFVIIGISLGSWGSTMALAGRDTAAQEAATHDAAARHSATDSPGWPICRRAPGAGRSGDLHTYYVTMRDSVHIAVDVVLPAAPANTRFPAVLEMTRYWRSADGDPVSAEEEIFTANGYAIIVGDVRGTGASSGVWRYHRSRAETQDFTELIRWIARQPWSDGRVVGYGLSYSANTADWMAAGGDPALKAIVARFPDYDPYADLYFPGGIPNRWMAQTWGLAVKRMDLNERTDANGDRLSGVRPVESDAGGTLLEQALSDRRDIPSVYEGLKQVTFRDDRPSTWNGASMDDWSIFSVRQRIDRLQIPVQSWGSWFDSGVANGVLHRFMTQSYPQRDFIGAWTHGGLRDANPLAPRDAPATPSRTAQMDVDLCFIDGVLGRAGADSPAPGKRLFYYTIGEDRWKSTTVWPIPAARSVPWYLDSGNTLGPVKPRSDVGQDRYCVDFTATTGPTNRWHTNGGVAEVRYDDRPAQDAKLLTYTSGPTTHDLEITGAPIADLFITADRTDGAFFVYLEDVDARGTVRYLTEGELRGLDRTVSTATPIYAAVGPYHSFLREDARELVPGQVAELKFAMMPISVRIPAGHRIRIAIAGADAEGGRTYLPPASGTVASIEGRLTARPGAGNPSASLGSERGRRR
jgi:putative CocE/NonD family hydrolase